MQLRVQKLQSLGGVSLRAPIMGARLARSAWLHNLICCTYTRVRTANDSVRVLIMNKRDATLPVKCDRRDVARLAKASGGPKK